MAAKLTRGGWPALLQKVGVVEVEVTLSSSATTVLEVEGDTVVLAGVLQVKTAGGTGKTATVVIGSTSISDISIATAGTKSIALGDGPILVPANGQVKISGNAAVPVVLRLVVADVGSLK